MANERFKAKQRPDSNVNAVKVSSLVAILTLLAGCAQTHAVPVVATAATHRAAALARHRGPLLYVADAGNDSVTFFSYPLGKRISTLTGFGTARGLCVSKGGDVYVVDAQKSEILRYLHGASSPSKVLYDQEYAPNACALDPLSGTLAATLTSESKGPGVLAIFAHANGRPVYYGTATITNPAYCAFDDKGNLFIDGTDFKGNFALGMIPFGYRSVFNVKLNQTIAVPGGIQWDGTYLAVGDEGAGSNASTIYQFTINSTATSAISGTLEGTVNLDDSSKVEQFSIDQSRVVGPNSGLTTVGYWHYPAGGAPERKIAGFEQPIAAVVSGD